MLCDNLSLPFRDESLDAVLSVAVIHHIATAERRVRALRELARVIRVGGRVMISVWAMEQRHRKVKENDLRILMGDARNNFSIKWLYQRQVNKGGLAGWAEQQNYV